MGQKILLILNLRIMKGMEERKEKRITSIKIMNKVNLRHHLQMLMKWKGMEQSKEKRITSIKIMNKVKLRHHLQMLMKWKGMEQNKEKQIKGIKIMKKRMVGLDQMIKKTHDERK